MTKPVLENQERAWRRVATQIAPYLLLVLLVAIALVIYRLVWGAARLHWGHASLLFLLLLIPVAAFFGFHHGTRRIPLVLFSRNQDLLHTRRSWWHHLSQLPRVLRLLALTLLIVAMAFPQRETNEQPEVEGIDIVLALDVSHSMSEHDLVPDRLTAAKEVLKRFIRHRQSDRVGLVIFGREAFTQCPLTLDYGALITLLDQVQLGLIDGRGTAIGNALGTALNRLRKSDAKSKVIILLTDGDNNSGNLAPEQAARYAQNLGVRVFTILMGRETDRAAAHAPSPFGLSLGYAASRYPINPRLLETIAQETGGTPYLATDTPALEQRFQSILDELDRSRFREQREHFENMYPWFLLPAIFLLLAELALRLTRFRRFP